MISEAKLSALLVAGLTGIGLTLVLAEALRSVTTALTISVPVAVVMGAVMALFATDEIKTGGDTPKKDK